MPIVFNSSHRITINFHDYLPIQLYRPLCCLLKITNLCLTTARFATVIMALALAAMMVRPVFTGEFCCCVGLAACSKLMFSCQSKDYHRASMVLFLLAWSSQSPLPGRPYSSVLCCCLYLKSAMSAFVLRVPIGP